MAHNINVGKISDLKENLCFRCFAIWDLIDYNIIDSTVGGLTATCSLVSFKLCILLPQFPFKPLGSNAALRTA